MMNGMRKIGQKSGAKRIKECVKEEEELNFDKEIEETLEDENKVLNSEIFLPLEVEMLKSKDKLDEDLLHVVEDVSNIDEPLNINDIDTVTKINELPKLTMKGENIQKQMSHCSLIKIDQEIELNPEQLEEIELPSDTVSKNSMEEDHRSESN